MIISVVVIVLHFQDKFLEDEDGNFFGFNYNSTVKEQYGLGKSIIGSINYMYDNIIESYVEDIYTGVIEDYTIATVKVGVRFKNVTEIIWLFFS